MTTRWGIAGPGRMAAHVSSDFQHVPGAVVTAVGSRSLDRAEAFAARFPGARAYGSYQDLMAAPDVDVIYIATPNAQHKAIALAAIEAGKGVLVEKSFTATATGTREVVAAARAKGVFAMEGMWTRFQPVIRRLHDVVGSGQIGELIAVQGDLSAGRVFNPTDRLFDPALGGGALLDVGVYVLSFAQDMLGSPREIWARGNLYPNGTDSDSSFYLSYGEGRSASLTCSLRYEGPGRMVVIGERGWIEVTPRFHHSRAIVVHRVGTIPSTIEHVPTGIGYSHELNEVCARLEAGDTESPLMPLDDTVSVADQMSEILRQIGAVEPADDDTVMGS